MIRRSPPLLAAFAILAGTSFGSPAANPHAQPAEPAPAHGPAAGDEHGAPAAESAPDEHAAPSEGHGAGGEHLAGTGPDTFTARAPGDLTPEEIQSALRIGETKTTQGDYAAAEIAYRQVLAARATKLQDRDALIGLARMYRKKSDLTRAAAVYEKILKEYAGDEMSPIVYLELGRTHRAMGAYKLAIARFYSVINATLKLPEEGADTYRQLARTAQFEVAETYFMSGNYEEASRFYARLKLLDLAPADRARAHFKSVYALTLTGNHEKAVISLRGFLELYPDDENAPEARYLLSVSLRRLGRNHEALTTALELLRTEQGRTSSDPKRWAYWQRKTGNQIANEFYEQGDFASALALYQGLAGLGSEPNWQLPVLYQMGLCLERLRQDERAKNTYQGIVNQVKALDPDIAKRPEFSELMDMANWRLKHLDWQQSTDNQLTSFLRSSAPPPTTSATGP